MLLWAVRASAVILWNDPDTMLAYETGQGKDILGGAVKRDDAANDTLYFKFHVDPRSDKDTEEYSAAFELFDGQTERLGVGNALKAWAYSAFFPPPNADETNKPAGYVDLHSAKAEASPSEPVGQYQYPQHGIGVTIVFKIQYVPDEDDLITVWLNPDLGPGATEVYQPESLTTRFNANARFDEIHLCHAGGGGGWTFSDMAIATSFSDFVDVSSARPIESAAGPADGALPYNFESWQKEQGLAASPIRALAQTSDGYLWIGSEEGVSRFDGLRFVPIKTGLGMNGSSLTALFADSGNSLWIGASDGSLSRWRNNQMTTVTPRDGLPGKTINALAEDSEGRLWIGTDAGLAVWQNGRPAAVPLAEKFKGQRITALCRDREGKIWLGAQGGGIFQSANNDFVRLTGEGVDEILKNCHCLLVDQSGRIWLGAGEDLVLCRAGDRWHRYRIPRNKSNSFVTTLAEEPDGTVWAGSAGGGLLQFKDDKFAAVPAATGLAGNHIGALLIDRAGKLWVGTEGALNRLQRRSLFAFGQNEGLGFGAVQGLAEVAPGVIWAAKPNGSLYRWDGKTFGLLPTAGLPASDSQVSTMLVTRDGQCWVATANNLLLYKDPGTAADEVKVVKLAKPEIVSLAEDRESAFWAGTSNGKIWRLRQGQWQAQTNLVTTKAITCILPDGDGSIWFGTDGNGLYQLENGTFKRVDDPQHTLSEFIRTLYLDAQGTLWIGTVGGGLGQWRNGRIASFTTREGLPDNTVSQILEDNNGRLWLGTGQGIACVSKRKLDDLAAGNISALYPQVFGRTDGMLSEECTGGFGPAGLKTKSGLLWFSTMKGVTVVDPRIQTAILPITKPILEEVLVDGNPSAILRTRNSKDASTAGDGSTLETLRIIPGKHRVEFRYTAPGFDAPEMVHFRYRLEGLDTDWVEAGTRRTAFYGYLPAGDYHFRVGACNLDGVWTDNDAGLDLKVLRHFWQAWWFIALVATSLMILLSGTIRLVEKQKLQRRLKRLEQEHALERERARIAQDLHDEMGAKLCKISFLSEHARRGNLKAAELQDQIASISDTSREVLHSLDEIVWAVNPQNDTLEHVASYLGQYAQDYFQMTGILCELEIPAQLPPHPLPSQIRHHLFLATQEALTNILKHSGATHARISMICRDATFEITVTDDGKSFPINGGASVADPPVSESGNGLINMRQRLADIGGRCSIESAPGRGTTIKFAIHLNSLVKNSQNLFNEL